MKKLTIKEVVKEYHLWLESGWKSGKGKKRNEWIDFAQYLKKKYPKK